MNPDSKASGGGSGRPWSGEVVPCPQCGQEIPEFALACPYCGSGFQVTRSGYCPQCRALTGATAAGTCEKCGGEMLDVKVEWGPTAEPAAPAAEKKQTEFDVILKEVGLQQITVIKVARALTGLGLPEAMELVEGAPHPVKQAVSRPEAEDMKKQLEAVGATVEITAQGAASLARVAARSQVPTAGAKAEATATAEAEAQGSSPQHAIEREPRSRRFWVLLASGVGAAAVVAAIVAALVFGPLGGSTTTTELSTAAINTWTELSPAGEVPPARMSPAMVYDPASGKVILFGGSNGIGAFFNDTWAYDPAANSWSNLSPAGDVPSVRHEHAMVYDAGSGTVILFGGLAADWSNLDDTWAYDPAANTWTELHPAGDLPTAKTAEGPRLMAYDAGTGKAILFGGNTGYFHGAWAYDPATNTWTHRSPLGDMPSKRLGGSMVYEAVNNQVILFGGCSDLSDPSGSLNDTWAYDLAANTWTDLEPAGSVPSARALHQMAYDPATGKVILFGGRSDYTDSSRFFNDTWAYDPAANTWTELHPAGDLPFARFGHPMVHDSATGKVILFGGCDGSQVFNDTWAYDPVANTWTELHPAGTVPSAL
jgi:ribosomal protein L7/L12